MTSQKENQYLRNLDLQNQQYMAAKSNPCMSPFQTTQKVTDLCISMTFEII